MITKGIKLLFGICLFPVWALASGNEIIIPFFIQVILIFIFLIILTVVKLRFKDKLILALSYFATIALMIVPTWNVDYNGNNRTVLNFLWLIVPAAIAFITFRKLRAQDKKI